MARDFMNDKSEWNEQPLPEELKGLLASYREALPDADPAANFMPALWSRIESRKSFTYTFRRLARGLVTAAVAACLVMSGLLVSPRGHSQSAVNSAYIDVLDAHIIHEVPGLDERSENL